MTPATIYKIDSHYSQDFNVAGRINVSVANGTAIVTRIKDNHCVPAGEQKLSSSHRYTCTCSPELLKPENEKVRYALQVVVRLPPRSDEYARRIAEGTPATVCIDPCIVNAIRRLWRQGIETVGCCCGHNEMPGWVQVHQKDYERMFELGYEQVPVVIPKKGQVHGLYCFYL